MADTRLYRTRTEYIKRNNGHTKGKWEIALDIGYSSVKLQSPNMTASFPAYARRVDSNFQFAGKIPDSAILYREPETEQCWLVGAIAQDMIERGDTTDSESVLYGRDRYMSDMFTVITRTGFGIACQSNLYGTPGGNEVILQTGLPQRYMSDTQDLKDVLAGTHEFDLRIGGEDWKHFKIVIEPGNIDVLPQPKGTLFSVCIDKNGEFTQDAAKLLTKSVIVFDPGFGTLDIFPIYKGIVKDGETYPNLGMKRVLHETSRLIRDSFNVEVPVPAMQQCLETGKVRYINKKKFESKEYSFDKLLETASKAVCNEAILQMADSLDIGAYDYLIVTGGTGEAWYGQIKDILKGYADTLEIIPGNRNDDLSFIYANVRGYYLYRYNKLKRGQ